MNIPDVLLHALQADASLVTAGLPTTAIYSSYVPKAALVTAVWLAFERVSGGEESAHNGDQGLSHPRYQLTIGGMDKAAIDRVRDILVKYNGKEVTVGSDTLTFFHADDAESSEQDTRVYTSTVDLFIWANT